MIKALRELSRSIVLFYLCMLGVVAGVPLLILLTNRYYGR